MIMTERTPKWTPLDGERGCGASKRERKERIHAKKERNGTLSNNKTQKNKATNIRPSKSFKPGKTF